MFVLARSYCRLLVFLSGLLCQSPALNAATVAVCNASPVQTAGMLVREMRQTDGGSFFLVVADSARELGDCQSADIATSASRVRWLGPAGAGLPDEAPASLTLIGQFETAPWQVSEINIPASAARQQTAVLPMPYAENLLAHFVPRIFGREERAVWLAEEGALSCKAGTAPAGLVFEATRPWYGNPQMILQLQYSGAGSIVVAIAQATASSLDNPMPVGTIRPTEKDQTSDLLLPAGADTWQSLVFLCPAEQAELALITMRLLPPSVPVKARRSAWFWSPAAWQEDAAALSRLARQYQLQRLYLSIQVNGSNEVMSPRRLAQFISDMGQIGVEVWAVAGDPRDVLAGNHPALQARMQALLAYNAAVDRNQQLSGIQLDIEPYLLPGFNITALDWQQRYRDTITLAAEVLADQMPLSIVVPVWWGNNPLWGAALLEELAGHLSGITVMNYRTSAGALRNGSLPFLYGSGLAGMPVEMAVEIGSVGVDQTRLNFARADEGRLLLLRVGDSDLLVLMDEPIRSDGGVVYREVASSVVSSANVSFQGNIERLESVLASVVPQWSAWERFSGVAIHGLEEHFLPP